MARVESHKIRQAVLQVGSSMETSPVPDTLQLFLEDGTPVDVGKDRTRARWRGEWTGTPPAPYEQNDFVMNDDKLYILADMSVFDPSTAPSLDTSGSWVLMTVSGGMAWKGEWNDTDEYDQYSVVFYGDGLWIAPDDIEANTQPGYVIPVDEPDVLFTNRAVAFTEADRFNSEMDVLFEINDETGRDNDISGGLGAVIYIDKSGSTSGLQLIITPLSIESPDSVNVSSYYPGGTYRPSSSGTEDSAAVAAHTPLVVDIEDGTEDMAVHIFFGGSGYDATFNARVNDNTNLVAPPVIEAPPVEWEAMFLVPETGGFKGSWDADYLYPAGSIVRHNDMTWGSPIEVSVLEPGVPVGSDLGAPFKGVQGKTTDRIAEGVIYTKNFLDDAYTDTDGKRMIPIVIDFVDNTNHNLLLTITNNSDSSTTFFVDGSAGAADSIGGRNPGATYTDAPLRYGTFWGGGDPHTFFVQASDLDVVGTITIKVTGADLVPEELANPWIQTDGSGDDVIGLPVGGTDGQILTKQSGTDGDADWEDAPSDGGGGGGIPTAYFLYDNAQYNTNGNSYGYAGSAQIVVPEDGDYEISMSAWLAVDNTSSGYECRAGVAIDGTVDNGMQLIKSALETPAYAVNSHGFSGRVMTLTAGDVIRPMYKAVGSSGTVYIEHIRIALRPVIVG